MIKVALKISSTVCITLKGGQHILLGTECRRRHAIAAEVNVDMGSRQIHLEMLMSPNYRYLHVQS
jgi:hypothetical protein